MTEYTPTDARRDALRAISDNFFMAEIGQYSGIIWRLVTAVNADEAKAIMSKQFPNCYITIHPTLNAIEETIK